MAPAPTVALDVIGTLFSLERLRPELERLGAPGASLELWFAQSLRDFFAHSHAGGYVPLAEVLGAGLARMLAAQGIEASEGDRATVLDAMSELEPAPGAEQACAELAGAGCRLIALTNGSAELARGLLERSGLDEHVGTVRSCDEVRASKPAPEVYAMARADEGETWMLAAHAWDVAGAQRAGLRGAWVALTERDYLAAYPPPDVRGASLAETARALLAA